MPIIYMKHPLHGAKVATMDLEAEFDERHGWERFDPTADVSAEPVAQAPANMMRSRRKTATIATDSSTQEA